MRTASRLVIVFAWSLAGCVSREPPVTRGVDGTLHVEVRPYSGMRSDIDTPEQCTAIGAWWTMRGEKEVCIVLPTDVGRRCRDDSECEAFCLAPLDKKIGQRASGECASGVIGSCDRPHVRRGKVERTCVV